MKGKILSPAKAGSYFKLINRDPRLESLAIVNRPLARTDVFPSPVGRGTKGEGLAHRKLRTLTTTRSQREREMRPPPGCLN